MATQQISLRLPKGLYLMSLLLAAKSESTVTDVITSAMHDALAAAFESIPADAKGHLAEMASRKDVDMVDARVSMRLSDAGVPASYEVGTLFSQIDTEEPHTETAKASDTRAASGAKGKKK